MQHYVVKFQNDVRTRNTLGPRDHTRWNNGQFNAVDLAQARMIAETLDGAAHITEQSEHRTRAVIYARVYLPGLGQLLIPVQDLSAVAKAMLSAEQEHREQTGKSPASSTELLAAE